MTTAQRRRLFKLAAYHETEVSSRGFHMRDFGHCAAHNACNLFEKAGFKKPSRADCPHYRGSIGFSAIDLFFGSETYAAGLFSPGNPAKTPKQWAKQCREFLKNTPAT